MNQDDQIRIEWVLRASEAKQQKAVTEPGFVIEGERDFKPPAEEIDRYAHAAFEPLVILTVVFSLGFLAQLAVRLVKDYQHGGLIIDLTRDPPVMTEDPTLDRGEVYVVKRGSVERIAKPDQLDILAALKAVVPGKPG